MSLVPTVAVSRRQRTCERYPALQSPNPDSLITTGCTSHDVRHGTSAGSAVGGMPGTVGRHRLTRRRLVKTRRAAD